MERLYFLTLLLSLLSFAGQELRYNGSVVVPRLIVDHTPQD
jgi:hypothetical protein